MVAMLAELGGLSDESEEAVWEVLENYIFYVVMPFLTDFFTADVPLVPPSDAPLAPSGPDNDSARSLDVSAVPSNDEDQARYGEI